MWAAAVQRLWERITGSSGGLRLASLAGSRRYEVRSSQGAVTVAATDAISACVGIHRYLIDACGVRVTWDTPLPLRLDDLPDFEAGGEARVDEFYYLNFCTFSYSTAYWDWDEWEREIDWMALHGVTMPLNLVGHEAVLALAYSRLGMSDVDIRTFLGGPAYLPWVYMGCLDSFAGPLPEDWIPRHLELGQRILRRQRELGMRPVLPAFTGHVPPQLAPPGARTRTWQGMKTTVVDPGDPLFLRLSGGIVAAQQELLGTDHLYAADPFIEMVPASDPGVVAKAIVDGLRAADAEAIWVLQSWPFSYQSSYWTVPRIREFLEPVPRDGLIILDLWGEADPQWPRLDSFAGRPWIWNGLLNFGGRTDPVASLASCDRNLSAALASGRPPVGLGLTMEAIHNNPAFFELIADRAWTDTPLDDWIRAFGRQRYGLADPAVALSRSVFDADPRSVFPERFISIAVTKPDYTTVHDDDIRSALYYDPRDLLDACRSLDGDDLALACVAMLLRVIDHRYLRGDAFLDVFDDLDDLVGTRPFLRLETWVSSARRWASDPSGERVLEDNARRILTVWNTPENAHLDNYSARIWSGLVSGYYKRRWELWLRFLPNRDQASLDASLRELAEEFIASGPAPREPSGDVRTVAARVLDRYGDEFLGLASTEQRNPRTVDIDLWPTSRVVEALLAEDAAAVEAAAAAAPTLAEAVDRALERIARGGRVHYFGAGASGRLAVLDATEAAPTFGTPAGFFSAHFPGGVPAIVDSALDFEDASGYDDAIEVTGRDVAVGITASGSTRYVIGALTRAREVGALTVLITCNAGSPVEADVTVVAATGPEAITGSTRLKAGTATKALLNAFSTALMVRSGRTYSNLMVNLVASNDKLHARAVRVIEMATGLGRDESAAALARGGGDLPLALLHALTGRSADECRHALAEGGNVRAALRLLDAG
jgi:alpha-N-acetylglucosaminidase